jgi:transposase
MFENKRGGRPSKRPSEYELDMMYQTMTAKEIGEKIGVSETTVRKWITAYRKEARNNASKTD